ncbi:MAG: RDD family protein [Candidatus Bathyarchaeota archaeon]|nr:MAG: RDD family protein [Candidatus Bathyarchaeota archaeon]
MYCSKCGNEFSEDAKFCTKCGTPVNVQAKPEAKQETKKVETVIERFQEDTILQDFWIRRLVAYVIDILAVSVAVALIMAIVAFPVFIADPFRYFNWISFPFAKGIFAVAYFVIAETTYGTTIGKHLLGLKVVTRADQKISLEKAFIRNISKIHEVLLLLDVIIGIVTLPDLNQKYTDEIANTTITKDETVTNPLF